MTKSFEEFEVHKKGVVLTKLIFELLKNKSFEKEFGFKDQLKGPLYQSQTILPKVQNTIITSNL
jgi:hypothetical protein